MKIMMMSTQSRFVFEALSKKHFDLLLRWLLMPHVSSWWDSDVQWTLSLVQKKYDSYVLGFCLVDGVAKEINAFIVFFENQPIGYIQVYKTRDFFHNIPVVNEDGLGSLDFFIGEPNFLHQGLGSQILIKFYDNFYQKKFSAFLVDPDQANQAAIRCYEKAGFIKLEVSATKGCQWMLRRVLQSKG